MSMRANMKKKDHEARIMKRAREIAKSGRHNGWFYVAWELHENGEPLALQVLEKEPLRSDIDRICIVARKRKQERQNAPWNKGQEGRDLRSVMSYFRLADDVYIP